ncbi:MAG TPA: hypothetical protein VMU66_10410 [Gaiellales bacterium]|nr:hypothetical protein [Gaiellales bacterium]
MPGTVSPIQALGWLLVVGGFMAAVAVAVAGGVFGLVRLELTALPLFVGCAGCLVVGLGAGRPHRA